MGTWNDASCVGLSQWKQNDSLSSRKQIAFPSAHNKFLALLIEMWEKKKRTKKGTPKAQEPSEDTLEHHKLNLWSCKFLKMFLHFRAKFLRDFWPSWLDSISSICCQATRWILFWNKEFHSCYATTWDMCAIAKSTIKCRRNSWIVYSIIMQSRTSLWSTLYRKNILKIFFVYILFWGDLSFFPVAVASCCAPQNSRNIWWENKP